MKCLGTLLGAGSLLLSCTQASATIESHPLLNQQHLWEQLPATNSVSIQETTNSARHSNTGLIYRLEKVVGEQPQYEHYSAYFQGKPVLDSTLVIARNAKGDIVQSMGKLLRGHIELANNAATLQQDLVVHISALYEGKQPQIENSAQAYVLNQGKLLSVTVLQLNHEGHREQLVLDNATGDLMQRQSSVSFFSPTLTNNYVAGGAIGGNEKLGAICYSPQPDSMQACTEYRYDEYAPMGARLHFSDTDPNAIFAQFSGFPLIVNKDGNTCRLENPYLSTFDARDQTQTVSYACGANNENFDSAAVTQNFSTWFTYSHASEAHFNAGLVMQFFHQQFAELYPSQSSACDSSGYCIKPLKQKVHSNTIYGTNRAFWDGEYVNYGSGDGYNFYSLATLSIAAHEIGHAINSWNAGIGSDGIDGAINEGFSDLVTIAVMDYFERNASGAYTQTEAFIRQFQDQAGQYSQNRKWWFGWDAIYQDNGARFYELPSWDGTSIDHIADYSLAKTEHANGGVLRKAFYELVKTKQWSIQDAFKVFLRANTAGCMFPNMSMDEFGYCVAQQSEHIEIADKSASQRKEDVVDVLLGVGIVADTNLSTLEANTQVSYDELSYDISHLTADTIEQISAQWGDGTTSVWRNSDNQPVYPFLQKIHKLPADTMARAAINVTLTGGETRSAYRHFFSRPANVNCPPYLNTPKVHTSSLKIANHEIPSISNDYTPAVDTRIPLAKNRLYSLTFDKDLSGKKLTVLYDINKNGEFAYTEHLLNDVTISGNTASFELNNSIPSSIALMRIAIADVDYSFLDSCGVVDDGQVIDVIIDADSPDLPIVADFSYQVLDENRVKFTNNSPDPQAWQPHISGHFSFNNQPGNAENPTLR
ncbi:M4 family metallopeptidase [Pseudoalteromonas sp. DL2-H2.2]|uniref:M4 family metallopeptidase n=1 Tax=Pseudoalteromonas sp. DL2-H2.2 TaxID=2908889 RepID=UPI001F272EF6|nr:M4 family metallopeptidase [Pseudoalteromonas sp. DL2-H2.2]MCF2910708.1 M4 family metallopeptidase [Pseudoalteromonas sp. DL2-H2.2]